jgi:hypothetical protein
VKQCDFISSQRRCLSRAVALHLKATLSCPTDIAIHLTRARCLCRQAGAGAATAHTARPRHLEPLHMVWVIQRDFLQGTTTQAALEAALAPVPNPKGEPSIEQVCAIQVDMLGRPSLELEGNHPQRT